jgi:hypothetical protein
MRTLALASLIPCSTLFCSSAETTPKRSKPMIDEIQVKGHDMSAWRVGWIVTRRYYFSLVKMSFRLWMAFLWANKLEIFALLFLILA